MAVNSFNAQNPPLTTKGDLFTFSTIPTRLGIGSNNQVLTADSTAATGMKWAAPAAGKNYTLLGTGTLTGASTITVSGVSNADSIFVIIKNASGVNAGVSIGVRINGDTASNYKSYGISLNSASTYSTNNFYGGDNSASAAYVGALSNSIGSEVFGYVRIDGCNSSGVKPLQIVGMGSPNASNGQFGYVTGGFWNNSATVTSISLFSNSGNFDNGTFDVYTSA